MTLADTLPSAATHGGPFHADDVLAGAWLLAAHPGLRLVRTRDADELARHPVVFDVGGRYDPGHWRLDHHFRDPPRREDGSALSSVGLLARHGGAALLARMGAAADVAEGLARMLDERVVRVVDAVDTGEWRGGPPPAWVSALVSETPAWDEQPAAPSDARRWLDVAYERQVALVATALRAAVADAAGGATPHAAVERLLARIQALAEPALARGAAAFARAGPAIVALLRAHAGPDEPVRLPSPALPWGPLWFAAEREAERRADQVLFQDLEGVWIVQSVPVEGARFVSRVPFPERWGGSQGQALAAASGIADAVFCHPGRFIAGFGSEAGARRAAALARAEATIRHSPG